MVHAYSLGSELKENLTRINCWFQRTGGFHAQIQNILFNCPKLGIWFLNVMIFVGGLMKLV